MVVTNRKLPIRRYYDPTIIMDGTVELIAQLEFDNFLQTGVTCSEAAGTCKPAELGELHSNRTMTSRLFLPVISEEQTSNGLPTSLTLVATLVLSKQM